MGKSRSANSVRNVSFGFAQQLITLVLAFVTRTIFVRKLGAEYTGVNGLYTNIPDPASSNPDTILSNWKT